MQEHGVQGPIDMARGSLLRIEDGRDLLVSVRVGVLWLTQEGDGGDYILRAGEEMRLDRDGRMVACALGRSIVALGAPRARAGVGRRLLRAVRRFWLGVEAPQARPTTAGP